VELTQDADGGLLRIFYADGRPAIAAGTTEQTSFLNLKSRDTLSVSIRATKQGGQLSSLNSLGRIVATIFSRPDGAGEVEARSPSGSLLAGVWGSASAGGTFGINNSNGNRVVSAFPVPNGGQLAISNSSGTPVGWLFANKDDAGSVQVGTGNGSYSVNVQAFADRSGRVEVTNFQNTPVLAIGVASSGEALISAASSDGMGVFQAGADENGGYASVMNATHVETVTVANQPSGHPIVGLFNPTTRKRVGEFFSLNEGARLQLYSVGGQIMHSVPDQ
jgi:hypothetical protein